MAKLATKNCHHLTERCFFWGLRSPKIAPAKEKEREIERVKKRE